MIVATIPGLFLWLDAVPARSWVVAWVCFGAALLSSLWPGPDAGRAGRFNPPWLYAFLILLGLFGFLWPTLTVLTDFNPDEGQLLAGAITAWHRHLLWSIDVGYCGPWSYLPLTLAALLGQPIDYFAGRCIALLMTWGTIMLVWLSLRHLFTDRLARILVLPMVCFTVFTRTVAFAYYSGEQTAQFYLAVALWCLVTAIDPAGMVRHRRRLFAGGVFLGILPFSKLQVAPLGLLLGGFFVGLVLLQPGARRIRNAAWLIGGTVLALGFALASIIASGSLMHFYKSYVGAGLAYAGTRAYPASEFGYWIWCMAVSSGFTVFLIGSVAVIAFALPFSRRIRTISAWLLWLGGLLFLGGYFVLWAPGRVSDHYLLFLLLPSTFFAGLIYGGLLNGRDEPAWWRRAWLAVFLGLGVAPQIYTAYAHQRLPFVGDLRFTQHRKMGQMARQLAPYQRPGDTLTVWGWACGYYVETQLPQGTREAHTERQMVVSPFQEYFRQRFLADLERAPPTFFVDAVGPGKFHFTDRMVYGHDMWPPLQSFVYAHYTLLADIETARVYVRRDRLATPPPP